MGLVVACNHPSTVVSPPAQAAFAEAASPLATPTPTPTATPPPPVIALPPPLPTPTATATPVPPPEVPFLMMEPSQGKQGEVIVLRVYAETEFALTGTFAGQTWPFWREGKVYWSLVGIAPWMAPGHYPLDLTATDRWGQQGRATVFLEVAPTAFPREYIELPEDKGGLLSQELLDGERVALEALLGQRRPQKLWQGLFVMPAEAGTSSAFGTRRSFSGGALSGPHLGMDIEARYGAPVVAANDGVVVLAQPLSVRGNVVIIDHGWGVYTGYFHLSQIGVPEGRVVRKGERIGLVGATGLATGPHLHWEMRVGGVPVDPLEWTRRPFP